MFNALTLSYTINSSRDYVPNCRNLYFSIVSKHLILNVYFVTVSKMRLLWSTFHKKLTLVRYILIYTVHVHGKVWYDFCGKFPHWQLFVHLFYGEEYFSRLIFVFYLKTDIHGKVAEKKLFVYKFWMHQLFSSMRSSILLNG